ncbi:hypothetical protein P2H44_21080 [Albimonas sp. CAU 1670]|uniref:COG3904 family protein n=1 Tax=Albimonas sp. CAU 1670 TaxID=3032599 RepID=UPI0023DBBD2E|nr:hypothetical protein [Albimonas sp. CAU 1670]MDF2235062.1 hypothetical protein [Albimonas sp. CAU 1670]
MSAETEAPPREAAGPPRPWTDRLPSARTVLRLCLLGQALVAGAVLLETGWGVIETAGREGIETAPVPAVSPGDQRRPFSPGQVPTRMGPEQPDEGPVRLPQTLPRRLTFSMHPTEEFGEVMLVAGAIDEGAAARLRFYLEDLPRPPDAVALHSPGGSVDEALKIGRRLRELDLDTLALPDAACLSACPYILAGGVERTVSRTAWVGLHQHYYDENTLLPAFLAVEKIQEGQGKVMEYLAEMGVDPLLMTHALRTPPEDMYLLVEEELTRYRLATVMAP